MKSKYVPLLFASSLAALAITSPAFADNDTKLASIRSKGVMRVAITQTSPPWTYLGDDNQPAGYDVEVVKEVAKRMGVAKLEFVIDSYKNFVEGLEADKYDTVFNDLSPTKERSLRVDFAEPYGVEDFRIFVKAGNKSIRGINDLKGKSVGVTTGSANEAWSISHLPGATIKGYDNGSFIFQDLNNGRLDAVIISHFGGLKYAKATNMGVEEASDPLTYSIAAPALRKGEPSLKAALSSAIKSMSGDGTLDSFAHRLTGVTYSITQAIATAQKEAAGESQ
ncbi:MULTISPECIES: transporter substrate-binding domain-containing protein [Bradyrhizobium]|uniref:transporter substrate-binding domain-containing protein n=1 Tax=Bradyrhizobium embrapense TaxID=630921 RepID=UPI00067D801F|nr:transporter substrate-binding domain-containing protein [Bradyrhizobium embrapense]